MASTEVTRLRFSFCDTNIRSRPSRGPTTNSDALANLEERMSSAHYLAVKQRAHGFNLLRRDWRARTRTTY